MPPRSRCLRPSLPHWPSRSEAALGRPVMLHMHWKLLTAPLCAQEKNGLVMESPGPYVPPKLVSKALDVDAEAEAEAERRLAAMVCSLENKDACTMCGS